MTLNHMPSVHQKILESPRPPGPWPDFFHCPIVKKPRQPRRAQELKRGLFIMAIRSLQFLSYFVLAAITDAWPSQEPFWPRYDSRHVQVLNGTWNFGYGPSTCDPTSISYADVSTPNVTEVPSSFDVAPPGVLGPRLPCVFFRSTHSCTPGTNSLVKFYAVNHYARVFMDGEL